MPTWLIDWLLTPAAFVAVTLPALAIAGADLVRRREAPSLLFALAPPLVFLFGLVPVGLAAFSSPTQEPQVLELAWRSLWPSAFMAGLCALLLAGSRAIAPREPVQWARLMPGLLVATALAIAGQVSADGHHTVAMGLAAAGTGLIAALLARPSNPRIRAAVGPVLGLHAAGVLCIVWCGYLADVYWHAVFQPAPPYTPVAVPLALLPLSFLAAGLRPDRTSIPFFLGLPLLIIPTSTCLIFFF